MAGDLEIGDVVKDSPNGPGIITDITDAGYPRVNHIAVAWLERADGVVFDPRCMREKAIAARKQGANMNKDEFWMGAAVGAIVGMLIITAVSIYLHGRDECENKLPRTEKCVQVWVPEARSKP